MNINKSLKELEIEAKETESFLQKLNINLPFIFFIPNTQDKKYSLAWQLCYRSAKYRLFLCEEIDKDEFSTTTILKPFIEYSLDIRLKYSSYLVPFIEAFNTHLKEFKNNMPKN